MVFFIVHFPKIQMNLFIFLMMMVYFTSAMGTIYYLVRVIVPRISKPRASHSNENTSPSFFSGITQLISKYKIQNDYVEIEKDEVINPTFFAGISRFSNSCASNESLLYEKSLIW